VSSRAALLLASPIGSAILINQIEGLAQIDDKWAFPLTDKDAPIARATRNLHIIDERPRVGGVVRKRLEADIVDRVATLAIWVLWPRRMTETV
jgi:hypothetical protein